MSEDWKAGDLAVCVETGRILCPHYPGANERRGVHRGSSLSAKVGQVFRVAAVRVGETFPSGFRCHCASLELAAGGIGLAARFRKLNDEPDDAALVAKIKSCRPLTKAPEHVG